MSDNPTKQRIQVNTRLTQIQISYLEDLTALYGSRSRALTAAIEMLWRATAEERRRFLVPPPAPANDPPDATPPSE